jgi:hypothetical protein
MATIAREHCASLSVTDFYARYMLPNRPVPIKIAPLTTSWRSYPIGSLAAGGGCTWSTRSCWRALARTKTSSLVAVHDCGAKRMMVRLPPSQMSVRQFLAELQQQQDQPPPDTAVAARRRVLGEDHAL